MIKGYDRGRKTIVKAKSEVRKKVKSENPMQHSSMGGFLVQGNRSLRFANPKLRSNPTNRVIVKKLKMIDSRKQKSLKYLLEGTDISSAQKRRKLKQ